MPVFGFTDIEGSTGLWEKYKDAMGPIIAKHYTILEESVAKHGGRIVKKTGDGIFAFFPDENGDSTKAALEAALEMQRRFQAETWPIIGELRVRMAFHCGYAEEMDGDFYGPTANRTARFMSLGWGGQILVSEDLRKTAHLPEGAQWMDFGLHQVKDLPEPQHIFGLEHPSLKLHEFPPLKSLSNRPNNLPEQLSAFVGRARELKEIAGLVAGSHSRLITLLGGGGMGKSRLAVQAGLDNLEAFKHGAYLADLRGKGAPDQLPLRILEALKVGVYRQKDPKEQLLEYLKDKNLLLILDSCEDLGGGAGLISEILEACPALRVLVCSRRRLNLGGQSVVEVRGLDYPQALGPGLEASACGRFFVQAAQGLQPGFSLKPEDRPLFLRICIAFRGMPLALELAAGWVGLLPLKTLAERLEKDPRFLSSTRQDMPEVHRSLKALFDSSWAPLSPLEMETLARLSAFHGGFSMTAAQGALRVRPETLSALADQSLLQVGEAGRYFIPETIRCFAAEKLEENPAKRDQAWDLHARYFCAFLKERERGLMGYDQARALTETRLEFANIQRAWDRAVEQAWIREIGQAARCLGLFTDMQGLARDWEARMERAMHLLDDVEVRAFEGLPWEESLGALASLLSNQANYLFKFGNGAQALEKMNKSLALFRRAGMRSGAAYALVRIAIFLGPEDERRRPALEEAANLYQGLGDSNGVAWARRNLGYQLCRQGNLKEGKPMVEESLAVFREVGNQRETAWALNSLGQLALEAGQTEAGALGLRQARDLFMGLGDLENAAWTLNTLGQAAIKRRLWAEARPSVEESLKLFGMIRHFRGRAQALRSLCEIHAGLGDLTTAFIAVDQVIADAHAAGDWAGQAGARLQKGQLLARQQKFDESLLLMQEAQADFSKVGSALGQGLALESQGCTHLKQGQPGSARTLFQQASQLFGQSGLRDGEARLCVRLGDLDSAEGKTDGGEAWYQKALKLSRQNKPGDYSLGALLGLAALMQKQGRHLEALHFALLCERILSEGLMPASEAEFYEELGVKSAALTAKLGSKLMRSVIDEARLKMAKEDVRAMLKESVEK
ncbi:MAG TPA: tetratricopeptide repeat protein [bacterium]|nr:tetratricopeptide repeat protein [bacterium]